MTANDQGSDPKNNLRNDSQDRSPTGAGQGQGGRDEGAPINPYEILGGEEGVRRLVDRFYQIMDTEPSVAVIREMHAADLAEAREKLFMFLSGWLGGPPLYIQKIGHPRLRFRHLPFPIGEAERDQWMFCMQRALSEFGLDKSFEQALIGAFYKTADFMRNKQDA